MKVTGFHNQLPCLTFISRIDGIDMVGEKMSPEAAVQLIDTCAKLPAINPISLLAVPSCLFFPLPRYIILCSTQEELSESDLLQLREKMKTICEETLQNHFHYKLARDLGQLDSMEVLIHKEALSVYTQTRTDANMIPGNLKIEPITLWPNKELPEIFESLIAEPLIQPKEATK